MSSSGVGPASGGALPAAVLDVDGCRAVAENIQPQQAEWLVL
jgi:hypothetical protein